MTEQLVSSDYVEDEKLTENKNLRDLGQESMSKLGEIFFSSWAAGKRIMEIKENKREYLVGKIIQTSLRWRARTLTGSCRTFSTLRQQLSLCRKVQDRNRV